MRLASEIAQLEARYDNALQKALERFMRALFIGHTHIDVTFLTDEMPKGGEKLVASSYAVSFGGNTVTAAFAARS